MTRTIPAVLAVLTALVLGAVLIPPDAFAQTSDFGENVGKEVKAWATALLLGVAALVAIPVLAKRDVNGGLVLALLVVILGGFAFAPGTVKQVITELWQSLV